MMREECWNDPESLEAEKMTAIQRMGGSQYFRKVRQLNTPDRKPGLCGGRNLKASALLIRFAKLGLGEQFDDHAETWR